MKRTVRRKRILHICCALITILLVYLPVNPACAGSGGGPSPDAGAHQATLSSPLILFQRVISRADGDRCPMAPSCSHYAAEAFKRHRPVMAWILTCDRLLRCGHDEVRLAPRVWINGHAHAYDPLAANTFWWHKH